MTFGSIWGWLTTFCLVLLLVGQSSALGVKQVGSEYVVVYQSGIPSETARATVKAAGGVIVHENTAVGVATVRSESPLFLEAVSGKTELIGAISNRAVGRTSLVRDDHKGGVQAAPHDAQSSSQDTVKAAPVNQSAGEPLAPLQWNMEMINASAANRMTQGDKRVLVGVIDTGIDGSHPDIAPNFSRELSRNFVPDGDAADVDEGGHGTHVAGIIAAPINGLGIAGVAPNVTVVNLRAGNDEGYFFLQPMVDALTYAGDIGVDVVNMSLYIDPWLFNCPNNPADSPAAQREQQAIIAGTQRALDYARGKGVTLIAAAGNGHTDLGRPEIDRSSPNFPKGAAYERRVDNSCLNMPTEGEGVIAVTSLGPSGLKAYYSDYGIEQADVAAPGGDGRDLFGQYGAPQNMILAPYPESLLRAENGVRQDGTPAKPDVVRDCREGSCAYYRYLQGTSMAAPHAAGVAALIIGRFGVPDPAHEEGITLNPGTTEQILKGWAVDQSCPEGRVLDYADLSDRYTAMCEGTAQANGFYGEGIVDARRAVITVGRQPSSRLRDSGVQLP